MKITEHSKINELIQLTKDLLKIVHDDSVSDATAELSMARILADMDIVVKEIEANKE